MYILSQWLYLQDTIDTIRIHTHAILLWVAEVQKKPKKHLISRRSIINICFFLLTFSAGSHPSALADSTQESLQKFVVTAYYSPLPNQTYYLRWDFEAEKKLNGNGTHWASGKPVYVWMLAAPKTYSFGTKIYFDGIGVWTVDDRWWAITASGNNIYAADRIDIWMWSGDEGLKRALLWWKREVYGKVVSWNDVDMYSSIDIMRISRWDLDLSKFLPANTSQSSLSSSDISFAQEALSKLSYFDGDINGMITSSLTEAIFQFQKDQKIVSSKNDVGAGNYWPKTQKALANAYTQYTSLRKNEIERIKIEHQKLDTERNEWQKKKDNVEFSVIRLWSPKKWEKWAHIRQLQLILKNLGYFHEKDTGIMGDKTIKSLIAYKKQRNVISNSRDILDGKTKEMLIQDLLSL